MKSQAKLTATIAAATAAFALSANAAVIYPSNTQAHNLSGGGGISSLFDDNDNGGTSKITKPDANDPSTWTAAGQAWSDDWQGLNPLYDGTNPTGTNSKVGWVTFEFPSVTDLDSIYIWNVSESTGQDRRVNTYNIYYANTPTVNPASGSGVDYNFASGGWTQLSGTRSLLQWVNGTGADGIETLGVSAQYVGLEFITHGGSTARVGLNEVVFTTAVPEPTTTALLGLGGLALIFRRRK